ncbi:hypothetical protein LB572_29430 [Mesorhizobium sp. BH1-1-5]|nr:hypothetical protein [Mesorhizobium sp. BH1-1-5]
MPIYKRAEEAGIFSSSDIALLGRVFDKLKSEHQSRERREALASRLLANFQAGIRKSPPGGFAGSRRRGPRCSAGRTAR